jgi:cellulose synthase (UDP-forming)
MTYLNEDLLQALAPAFVAGALCLLICTLGDRTSPVARGLATAASLVLMWRYIVWRVTETLPPLDQPIDFSVGFVFLAVEVLAALGSTFSLFFLTRTVNRTPEVEKNMPWLLAHEKMPRIDVLICTYNEEPAILERTIVGALWTTYPNVRIWVCDDGRRPWLEEMAAKYMCGYITRPDNAHAKAGNINNALQHLATLDEKPDYVAILDADFVPTPVFLTRAMTLFRDPNVAVVQTPQHFSNPDPIQANLSIAHAWPDEQRFFFDVIMPSKDAWGAAFCCGTSSILRFDRLMEIGGFPTTSVTEDYLVSLKLRQKGYQTVYLNERLSLGLAPEGLKEYVTQRSRWCLGFVQICRSVDGPWSPGNGLRLADRLILTETFLFWSAQHLFRVLGLIVPALYLIFGIEAVRATLPDAVSYFLPYYVMILVSMAWLTQGRVLAIIADVSQLLAVHEILKAVWAGLLRPTNQKFKVTAKGGDRTRRVVQWPLLRWFIGYLVLALAGVVVTFMMDSDRWAEASSAIALFWSWYNIVILLIASLVCIEQPRYRKAERYPVLATTSLFTANETTSRFVIDVSATGFRFAGRPPGVAGSEVEVEFHGRHVPGKIVRVLPTEFAVEVADDPDLRTTMLRTIYAEGYGRPRADFSAHEVGGALLARMFR